MELCKSCAFSTAHGNNNSQQKSMCRYMAGFWFVAAKYKTVQRFGKIAEQK
jgi:hypothetical protein